MEWNMKRRKRVKCAQRDYVLAVKMMVIMMLKKDNSLNRKYKQPVVFKADQGSCLALSVSTAELDF